MTKRYLTRVAAAATLAVSVAFGAQARLLNMSLQPLNVSQQRIEVCRRLQPRLCSLHMLAQTQSTRRGRVGNTARTTIATCARER